MPLIVEVMNFLIRWKAFGRVEGIGVEMKKVTYSVKIFPAVQASQNGLPTVIFTLCLGLRNRGGEPGKAYVVDMFNNEMGEPPQPELTDPLKNAPWAAAALASLGLFKLLNDWESQGFSIPMMTPPSSVTNNSHIPSPLCKRRKKDNPGFHPCKKLPDNSTLVHPVQFILM